MCRTHLAKQHGNKLIPTTEPFDPFLSFMLLHRSHKILAIYQIQHLPKTTTCGYHFNTPVCWLNGSLKPLDLFLIMIVLTQTGAFFYQF
jgi:hypothetical protein